MQDIFVQSQWDTILAYLQQGRPPLWQLLLAANGALFVFWLYGKFRRTGPPQKANLYLMRGLFIILNTAILFREDTMRMLRPFLRYFTDLI